MYMNSDNETTNKKCIDKCIDKCTTDLSNNINRCLLVQHFLNYKSIPGLNPCFTRAQNNNEYCVRTCMNNPN